MLHVIRVLHLFAKCEMSSGPHGPILFSIISLRVLIILRVFAILMALCAYFIAYCSYKCLIY